MSSLTPAQQEVLDGIQMAGGVWVIPPYRLATLRSALVLERTGRITLTRIAGGAYEARVKP